MTKKALIIVDMQNDFMPTGALPVAKADQIVDTINQLQNKFELIIATQDWHPLNHKSFAKNHAGFKPGDVIDLNGLPQVLWPNHCVENTFGAELVMGLNKTKISEIFKKGTDQEIDSYSGFFDNGHRKSTGLGDYLKQQTVSDVYIVGVATDYCVKYTALDAVMLGFATYVIEDACRAVDLQMNDVEHALSEMKKLGVSIINTYL